MRGGGFGVEGVRDVLEIVAIAIVDQESGSIEQFRNADTTPNSYARWGSELRMRILNFPSGADWLGMCGKARVTYSQDDYHFTT